MLITLARKPIPKGGTVVQTCLTYGTGSLNIDGTRIGTGTGTVTTVMVPDHRSGNFGQDTAAYKDRPKLAVQRVDQGRWPANVLVTHDVLASFPDVHPATSRSGAGWRSEYVGGDKRQEVPTAVYSDSGSAARFFKQIKGNDTP